MQLSQSERIARKELFAQIEAALLPDAATRINAIDPFDVESVMFGSKPTQKAYGVDGDLRFELGRWDDGVFVPFGARLLHPFRPPDLDVAYPKETSFLWRNMFSHYTPITRRLDYFEVWDYFSVKRATDTDVREKALGLLAARIASKHPAEKVKTGFRYIRYAEQYVVVTEVESRELAAAGAEEYKACFSLLNGFLKNFEFTK